MIQLSDKALETLRSFGLRILKRRPRFAEPDSRTIDGRSFGQWAAAAGGIEIEDTHVKLGAERYLRVLMVYDWPDKVRLGILERALRTVPSARMVLHMHPGRLEFGVTTRLRLRRLEAAQEGEDLEKLTESRAEGALRYLYRRKTFDGARLFDLWCFILLDAHDLDELDARTQKIEEALDDQGILVSRLPGEQGRALQAAVPSGIWDHGFFQRHPGRLADDEAIATLYPFTEGNFSDSTGVYAGNKVLFDDAGKMVNAIGPYVFVDMFRPGDPGNKNMLITGESGEGKSGFIKGLIVSLLILGVRVFVIDIDGEYRPLVEALGDVAVWIDHSLDTGRYFDPLIVPPAVGLPEDAGRLDLTAAALHRTISLLLAGHYPNDQKAAADRALMETWKEAGIDRDDQTTWHRPVSIHRWYDKLESMDTPAAKALAEALYRPFRGSLRHLFARPDDSAGVDFEKVQLVVYHIARTTNEMDPEAADVKMNLTFTDAWRQVCRLCAEGKYFSTVIVDEMQRLVLNQVASEGVNTFATGARKYNSNLVAATNKPAILWETVGGEGIWDNSAFKVHFYSEKSGLDAIAKHGNLPDHVINLIRGLKGTHAFAFRNENRGYDILRLDLPAEEMQGLYKTRGLKQASGE